MSISFSARNPCTAAAAERLQTGNAFCCSLPVARLTGNPCRSGRVLPLHRVVQNVNKKHRSVHFVLTAVAAGFYKVLAVLFYEDRTNQPARNPDALESAF
ncbi:MAG TPA: hypothetical protein VFA89_09805 [Terriglobales bacterium]|nr:hypothetical protein [Terriglobales bacterium]